MKLFCAFKDATNIRMATFLKGNEEMFTAALFTISKTWKLPKCPLTEEWIKKIWYVCTMEYHSAIKENEIMPFVATWMDLEIIILSEVSQTKTNIIYRSYAESKKE